MNKNWFGLVIITATAVAVWVTGQSVQADVIISYNNTVTAINGTGNPDGYWNSYLNTGLNLELSLKAQTTINSLIPPSPNDGAGTFYFPVGTAPGSTKSTWDFWFSVNTNPTGAGANNLNAYDFYLTFDTPAAPGIFSTPVNAFTTYVDSAYGNNSTLNGQGTLGTTATLPALMANNNIAQNAENIAFAGLPVNLTGNYDFQLYAVAAGAGVNGTRLGEVDMTVAVMPAPEPSTLTLASLGIFGLLAQRSRRKH